MATSLGCLLDSNILLRTGKVASVYHPDIELALDTLVRRGFTFCFTSQTLGVLECLYPACKPQRLRVERYRHRRSGEANRI